MAIIVLIYRYSLIFLTNKKGNLTPPLNNLNKFDSSEPTHEILMIFQYCYSRPLSQGSEAFASFDNSLTVFMLLIFIELFHLMAD